MNLDEAIAIISEEVKHPYSAKKMCRPDALKLGIGAIQQIKREREKGVGFWADRLPGETKD